MHFVARGSERAVLWDLDIVSFPFVPRGSAALYISMCSVVTALFRSHLYPQNTNDHTTGLIFIFVGPSMWFCGSQWDLDTVPSRSRWSLIFDMESVGTSLPPKY
jgi:hypothetical protein